LRHDLRALFRIAEAALVVNMTIFQNLALPLRYHGAMGEGEMAGLIDGWLERMELSPFRDSLPAALSSGLKRRVSFIRTVITPREFYFWDEPTQGASSAFIEAVVASVGEAKGRGASSVFATQNASFLGRVADRVLVLREGRVAYLGPLESGRIPVAIASEGMLRE
nr:ATP-binding cassette domain-containing protein [bacterium]